MTEKAAIQASVAAKAGVQARVQGILHSFEQNQIAFSVSFLVLFFGSLSLKALVDTAWTDAGAAIGACGLALQFVAWLFRGRATEDQRGAASVAVASPGRVIYARDIDPRELMLAMREVIQERKPLPPPEGAYAPAEAGRAEENRRYTSEEQNRITRQIADDLRAHDEQVLARLEELMGHAGQAELEFSPKTSPVERTIGD